MGTGKLCICSSYGSVIMHASGSNGEHAMTTVGSENNTEHSHLTLQSSLCG